MMTHFYFPFLLLAFLAVLVQGEIRDIRVILDADSTVIHYSEGYLVAPGYIDLSDLKFITTDAGDFADEYEPSLTDDQDFEDEVDDLVSPTEEAGTAVTAPSTTTNNNPDTQPADTAVTSTTTEAPVDGNWTGQQPPRRQRRLVGPGVTQLDVAILHLPRKCANTRSGCDWTELGIGARSPDGDVRWCCSNDAVEMGLCEGGPKYGSLIVNSTKFFGSHRYVQCTDPLQLGVFLSDCF